jgi:hypothetical protein
MKEGFIKAKEVLMDTAKAVREVPEKIESIGDGLPSIPTPYDMLPDSEVDRWGGAPGDARQFSVRNRRGIKQNVRLLPQMKRDEFTRHFADYFNPTSPDMLLNPAMTAGVLSVTKETDDGLLQTGISVPGPFSLYYPSALWPYQTGEGARYTVMDLAEEPIESDWLGLKPWAEWATDTTYDKVGALPGFRLWGDAALGAGAVAPLAVVGLLLFVTAPAWGPVIGGRTIATGRALLDGTKEFTASVGGKVATFGRGQ